MRGDNPTETENLVAAAIADATRPAQIPFAPQPFYAQGPMAAAPTICSYVGVGMPAIT